MKSLVAVNIYYVIKEKLASIPTYTQLDVFQCGWNRNVFTDVMLTFLLTYMSLVLRFLYYR